MKLPLVVGNWKMNRTSGQARLLAQSLVRDLRDDDVGQRHTSVEVVICPPFTALPSVADAIRGSNIALGAQNMHYERSGAFTGEISPLFLKELGCAYVILGHSERRQLFGETDELVCRKLKAALEHGLSPIVCLGETAVERENGRTLDVIRTQFERSICSLLSESPVLTIAYEPIWAIGTGNTASPQQAAEVHQFLRELAVQEAGEQWAAGLRIIYGGSVTPDGIDELMAQPQIDGVLVGSASLKAESFVRICRFRNPAPPHCHRS